MYAHIQDNTIVKTGPRPRWLIDGDTPETSRPLTDEEFAEHGWFPVQDADPVPEGKIVTGRNVQIVDGLPKWVNTLEDAPPPSIQDVVNERERRLSTGFDYDFDDERGVHRIGTTAQDMQRWMMEVTPFAQVALNAGQPDIEIGIFTDTGPCVVTAAEWQSVLQAAAAWRQPVYQASFSLQAMDPIPDDYQDDKWWPAA